MKKIKLFISVLVILSVVFLVLFANNLKTEKYDEIELIESIDIDLGYGIKLTEIKDVSGRFLEDGSGDVMEKMLSATFANTSDTTLQYGNIILNIDGNEYEFTISTLPPKAIVEAYEINRKTAPECIDSVSATANNLAFFQEEPQSYGESLSIFIEDGGITLENISGKDINKEISVFYKNYDGKKYIGGITYRVRVPGLKAGETIRMAAGHAAEETRIMFVTYGN